jgi:glycerol uptake facilitator-like aquaporin
LFLGIAAAAPFTGGHVNPAVTVGLTWSGLCESRKVLTYIVSQLVGAFVGVFICTKLLDLDYNCFGHSAEIYSL